MNDNDIKHLRSENNRLEAERRKLVQLGQVGTKKYDRVEAAMDAIWSTAFEACEMRCGIHYYYSLGVENGCEDCIYNRVLDDRPVLKCINGKK